MVIIYGTVLTVNPKNLYLSTLFILNIKRKSLQVKLKNIILSAALDLTIYFINTHRYIINAY